MMLIVTWPRSNWIRSRIWASSDFGATSAIVAAERATWPAARNTLASCVSCSRSVGDEVPRLLVTGRRRAPRGFQDPVQVLGRNRPLAVGPHVAPRPDRIPRLHIDLPQTRPEHPPLPSNHMRQQVFAAATAESCSCLGPDCSIEVFRSAH